VQPLATTAESWSPLVLGGPMDIWTFVTNSQPRIVHEFDTPVCVHVLFGHCCYSEYYYHNITHIMWEFVEDEQHHTVWYLKGADGSAHVIQKDRLAISINKEQP
jgi:hypothetical protein